MQRRDFLAGLTTLVVCDAAPAQDGSAGASPALVKGWESFARQFVQADGRVLDTGNQGITHTEGLGVAMLAAQACGDRTRFDKIWGFCRNLKRPDGLYSWKWVPGKGVADVNNATDGDLYIAWALHRAGLRWRDAALTQSAADLARSIRENCLVVTPRGRVLLPGVQGFVVRSATGAERAVVNPSYWALPAYRDLQAAEGNATWAALHRDALLMLGVARFGPRELPADWVMMDDPLAPWQERPARFGYEAIRVPLFLAWANKAEHPALRAVAKFMQQPKFPAWVALDSNEQANYAASTGFEAVARLVRKAVYGQPYVAPPVEGDYFSSSLVLMSLMAAQDLGWA